VKLRSSLTPIVSNYSTVSYIRSLNYVVLDRDNTLIEDSGYTNLEHEPVWLPNVIEGLCRIHSAGYGLVIATNQAALSKGFFTLPKLNEFHAKMNFSLKEKSGFELSSVIICPHLKESNCLCRKPLPGMLDFAHAIYEKKPLLMVGDSDSDIEAAKMAGVEGLKVAKGEFLKKVSEWLDSK
jgi:D-glycero-D-manno-heptose 1,7-bisphosphate phosphatase